MTRPETPDQRAERILTELRAATSEAAGVLKDLRAAMREARAQVDEYLRDGVQTALNTYTNNVQEQADEFNKEASAGIQGVIARAYARAQNMITTASTLERLCQYVAVVTASVTEYTPDGPRINLDQRIDWDNLQLPK